MKQSKHMKTNPRWTTDRPPRAARLDAPRPGFRAAQETALEQLKRRLLSGMLNETPEPRYSAPLHRAANDAASLAWATDHPLLFLPVLLEEKAQVARKQARREERIQARSRLIIYRAI
jgi:hypothetical protein